MQSGESDPSAYLGSDQGQEAGLPRGNKRPREPSRTSLDTESTDAPSSSRSRPILNQPPSQRGSSRDTNEMHRSTTPPEASSSGTIKYTRTGRVSKATKGQRVHHCEECGKVCCALLNASIPATTLSPDECLKDLNRVSSGSSSNLLTFSRHTRGQSI